MAQGITTDVNLQESFAEAKAATAPLEQSNLVAVSPSELLNGGKASATVENWKKLGFS